jgi:hypothetical protein
VTARPSGVWVKGQSGNPSGRPKLPDTTQRLREQGKIAAIEALAQVMSMTMKDIASVPKDPNANAALVLAASIMHKAIKTGCPQRAAFIFNYMVGKPESASDGQAQDDEDMKQSNTVRLAYSRDDLGA